MAGIYIHIPFCKQACNYCNFHFSTSLRYKNELVAALLKEIDLFSAQKSSLPAQVDATSISTIYFGGGTPSLCTKAEIESIVQKLRNSFTVEADAEITLEANPDDISEQLLIDWKNAGINRLSIGVQSFFEEELRWMNRAHSAVQALNNLKLARSYFDNITMDLIYGTPGLTDEKWKRNVETAIELGIPHLSCYALTVEPKTPLQKLIEQHKVDDIDPDKQSAQFVLLMEWMEAFGFEHYEVSNYAKPGFRSRHNSSYWKGSSYFGFGPSAHSFDGSRRWWNIANNNSYIKSINDGLTPTEIEELTLLQRLNEYIMISLRTMEGIDIERLGQLSNEDGNAPSRMIDFESKSLGYFQRGLLEKKGTAYCLTKQGMLLADGIAADLFPDQ